MLKQLIFLSVLLLSSSVAFAQDWIAEEMLQQLTEIRQELKLLKEEVSELKQALKNGAPTQQGGANVRNSAKPVIADINLEGLPSLGSSEAKVAIIEFTDYECPFCRRHTIQTIPELEENYIKTNKIQYFAKQFPLSFHSRAKGAAAAALCAEKLKKGSYWHYHEGLFSGKITFDKASYLNTAEQLTLNQKKYTQCLDSQKISERIDAEIAEGSNLGVSGTPAFFIGKVQDNKLVDAKFISGARPYEIFAKTIDSLL
jgi:protein-disulfide isomerase